MKGKGVLVKILIIVSILVVVVGCNKENTNSEKVVSEKTVAEKIYNLSFSCAPPDMHPITAVILKPWAKKVEEVTNGRVKITMHVGGTLVKAESMLEGVSTGLTDIGWVSNAYFPGELPLLNALAVPGFNFKRAKVASYVDRDFIKEFPESILDTVENMFVFSPAPGVLLTNTPVRTLEELRGLQIRCDGMGSRGLSLLGATPIAMPMAEAYESLSKSVIDGCVGPTEPLMGWNLAEVVKYMIEVPFMYNAMPTVIMNKKVWNSLPNDIQDAIRVVNEDFFEEVAASAFDEFYIQGLEYAKKYGLKVIELSAEEQERWMKELLPLQEQYMNELTAKGLPGKKAIETIRELADKYNIEFDEYDREIDARVQAVIPKI